MNEPLFGTVSGTMMPSQGFGLFPGSPPFCDPSLVFGFFASGGFFFYTRGFRAAKNGPHPGLIILDFSGERGEIANKCTIFAVRKGNICTK